MNNTLRGVIYGISLVMINFFISKMELNDTYESAVGFITFMAAGLLFLRRERLKDILICGFSALFSMVFFQILFIALLYSCTFNVYIYGFYGTMAALAISIVMRNTIYDIRIPKADLKDENNVFTKSLKIKMLVYALITAMSFSFLVMAAKSALGTLIFSILQVVLLYFVVAEKIRLLWCIPVVILCLNFFISGNGIWHLWNFMVCIILFSLMFTNFDIKDTTLNFFGNLSKRALYPFGAFSTPFRWGLDMSGEKKGRIKKSIIALSLSLSCVILLSMVLSSADMVFSMGAENVLNGITGALNLNTVLKIVFGVSVGVYLFGIVHSSYFSFEPKGEARKIKGDAFIISCVMMSALAVYTVFVVIQFRYLFSGAQLPYGLNITEYARKGFFELLALTGINIAAILTVIKVTTHLKGKYSLFMKWVNMYLCAVTVVLLASSFYRMWMYNETDGLTRLRFLVFGFLAFELIGLIITFFYIAKPKFNIIMVYGAIALCYYLVLNVVPMDKIIAKNQIGRFIAGERNEIDYVLTLSPDAADEIFSLYQSTSNLEVKKSIKKWFVNTKNEIATEEKDWRKFNLSLKKFEREYNQIMK